MPDPKWLALVPPFLRRRLTGRQHIQAAAGNAGWLVADKLIRLGLGLLVSVWTARYLGPVDFGLLSYAIAFAALFSILANLGLQNVIVRDLVTDPQRREVLLASALAMRIAGSGIAVVLAVAVAMLLRPHSTSAVHVIAIIALSLIPQAWDVIDFEYQSRIDARPIVIIRSLSFVLTSLAKLGLIVAGAGILAFAWVTTAEIILSAVGFSVYARRYGRLPLIRNAQLDEVLRLLRTAWPLVVSGLSVVLYWRIDQVMLGQLIGDLGVGLFSAAVRISEVWYFIPVALANSSAPILTAIFARSRPEFLQKLASLTRLMVGLGVLVAASLTLLARPIVSALYGTQYVGAGVILAIHAWAGIFVAVGVVCTSWFINSGLFRYSMYQTMSGAICNIALNLLLIPRFAGAGAAVATVVSQILSSMLLNAVAPQTRELFQLQLASFLPRSLIAGHLRSKPPQSNASK